VRKPRGSAPDPDEAGPVPAPAEPAPEGDAGGGAARPEAPDAAGTTAADLPSALAPAALRVTGPARGFRRAGRVFGPAPVLLPLAALSEAERAAIEAEPRLVVERVETEAVTG
jgi:hypothetical protein